MTLKYPILLAWLILCWAGRLPAAEPAPASLVLLVPGESVRLEVDGQALPAGEQAAVRDQVETAVGLLLKEQFGLRLEDDESMRKVRSDTEKWAVLTTGEVAAVRQALEKFQHDAIVRVSFPACKLTRKEKQSELVQQIVFFEGSATVSIEVVFKAKNRAIRLVSSPPMLEPVTGRTPQETANAALKKAVAGLAAAIKDEGIFDRAAPRPLTELAKTLQGKKVLFFATGTLEGGNERVLKQAASQVEVQLGGRLADQFAMGFFDEETLTKARRNAEQWAVLTGADVAAIRETLKEYAVDYCLRARWHASGSAKEAKTAGGIQTYRSMATMTLDVIDLRVDRGTKALVVESPPMGTNDNPAVWALDLFDAEIRALDVASRQLVERLGAPAGGPVASVAVPAVPGLPTVAVLWVKSDFKPWRVPRLRQAVLTRSHQKEVDDFVDECRKTERFGLQVSQYLQQGLVAGGRFVPVEESGQRREDLVDIKNKLLELRMDGWVGKKLPYDQPVKAAAGLGADYLVTARITEIEEVTAGSGSMAGVVSYAKSATAAKVEVTITETKTGKKVTVKEKGTMEKEGWSTLVKITPELSLDTTLLGLSIKDGLLKAAAQLVPFGKE